MGGRKGVDDGDRRYAGVERSRARMEEAV